MNRVRYYVAWSLLHIAVGIDFACTSFLSINRKLGKFAMRIGGVNEEETLRERMEEVDRRIAERDAAPPDKYSIDLTTWKGRDGSPVIELIEISPEQFSALSYTAGAKRVTVESLLGEAVRKAVAV